MDKRKNYGIILDTETANTITAEDGKLNMLSVLPYDLGFMIIDTKGRIYEKYSFVIKDIFNYETELMQSAYYSSKMPQYKEDLLNGKRILTSAYHLRQFFQSKYNEYNCQFAMAHNARFDYRACNNLQRWTTKSKYRFFFPYGCEIWDTLKMARDVILPMPTYQKFCADNGYLTKIGKPRLTAEILYRFISKNNDFVESHTGLEDCEIELEIYKYCIKQHKTMRKKLFEN